VTTREKLIRAVLDLPEDELDGALEYIASRGEAARPSVDAWGDLSELHEVAFGETMRRLAEEERQAGHEPW